VTGCATGVDIDQSGSGDLTAVTFRENGRAVAVGLRARIAMRGCLVEQSREVGLFISRQAEGTVTGSSFIDNPLAVRLWQKTGTTLSNNLFRGNGKGIVADQTEAGPRLLSNVFSGNGTAALVVNGSSILIEGNLFAGNGTGVEANQVSVPELSGNTFSENKTAVSFLKRSRGRVVGNLFLNNGRALFCDYSSYPRVTGNNFEGKGMAVSLGENQSYDWETREGKHPTPLPGQPTPPPAFPVVDASGNWWGVATTAEMGSAGTDGNIAAIDDGLDHPSITYEGYAGRNYRMDKVVYRPFRREPVKDAGAPRDYLKGLRFPGAANPLAGK
jgi:parallel beta-helix repeat protein